MLHRVLGHFNERGVFCPRNVGFIHAHRHRATMFEMLFCALAGEFSLGFFARMRMALPQAKQIEHPSDGEQEKRGDVI